MRHARKLFVCLPLALLALMLALPAQAADDDATFPSSGDLGGLNFRLIGPASTGGRVSDLIVDPTDNSHWYVAVASGGLWETKDAGTQFQSIFDGQGSYSIGCIALDPSNPRILWVGTGENNSQRSVSYGDGVYKSIDGGKHFEKVGLDDSQHVGMIRVDPRDSDVVYVAAQGPLWNTGGDRGLYKTTDGGQSWNRILHIDEDTGVSEVHLDPRDADTLYAVTYQRRRHTWTLINGGPGSGLQKSTDGGATWTKLTNGLPSVDIGRIGMCISANPDMIYALVEAAGDADGTYVSTDAGLNWEKRNDYRSGSPQYYQELFADPVDPNRVFSMDTYMHYTEDGGRSWQRVNEWNKHVDNHALWINPADTRELVAGCDGGIYQSFDRGQSWKFLDNIPITQFYKIAVDDEMPFYNVYGGTQDNFTLGAPNRSTSANGIRNSDWTVTLGGDGFEPAIEPGNPDVLYSQYQYGNLHRFDRKTGENHEIQPQPEAGMPALRWNWSSALMISPHKATRLYYGCQILFRSEDRGQSWKAISGDLSRNLDRNQLEVMSRVQSVDAVAKNNSTSPFGTIVSVSESPLQEDLLYAGTDDGLIQVSSNAGGSWTKYDKFSGVPEMAYISSLEASQHQADRVYVTIDNHKQGDFTPYVLRSDNRGKSWKKIAGNLPERGQAWSIVEDHVDPNLLFVGTEFGVFYSRDGGDEWTQLKSGLPPIACRDLDIVAREDDLVVGTFGRGIYVLDDYSPLRNLGPEKPKTGALLFAAAESPMFIQKVPLGLTGKAMLGDDHWFAENPPVGAQIRWFLPEGLETREERRQTLEKDQREKGDPSFYPPWEELRAEDREEKPAVILTIRNAGGDVVRRLVGPPSGGLQSTHWDFRYAHSEPVDLGGGGTPSRWSGESSGPLAMPGNYTVELHTRHDGKVRKVAGPVSFACVPLVDRALPAAEGAALEAFQMETADLQRRVLGLNEELGQAQERVDYLKKALLATPKADLKIHEELVSLDGRLADIAVQMRGDRTISRRSEPALPGLIGRVQHVVWGHWESLSPATESARMNLSMVEAALPAVRTDLAATAGRLEAIRTQLLDAGGPWTP